MRCLDRLRVDPHPRHLVEGAVEGHLVLGPCPADDLELLVEALAGVHHRDAEAVKLVRLVAAAEAELEAAPRQDVDLGHWRRDSRFCVENFT